MSTTTASARAPRPTTRHRRWLGALALSSLVLGVGAANAVAAPAAGNAKPYALSASATIAQDGSTELALTVTSNDATYSVPTSLKHVQLKSFNASGELVYTKNLQDVATPSGATTLTRSDLQAGQRVKVQAQAQTGSAKNTQVLETNAVVLRQPDLTVADAGAPAQVAPNTPLAVSTVIQELNGDLGASGTVTVSEGATTLDSAPVSVLAGATTNVGLAVVLSQPGTHTLTVSVGSVTPAEWDTTNNSATIEVEVIQPNQTLDYSASYGNNVDYNYHWQSDGSGYYCGYYYGYCGPREYHQNEHSEWLSVNYWTSQTVSPTGTFDLTISTEAGTVETIHATNLQWDGWNSWYWYDSASNTQMQVYSSGGGSNVYVWHNAGQWTYSDSYCDYWYGCSTYNGSSSYGHYWNAQQELTVDLDLASGTGDHFGGSIAIGLSPYDYAWDYWYWDWYYGNVHYWGNQHYFNGYAYGTTTW
jgi:hypothetical protein